MDKDLKRSLILSRANDGVMLLSALALIWVLSRNPPWWMWLLNLSLLTGIGFCLVLAQSTRRTIHDIQTLRDETERIRERIRKLHETR